MLEINGRHIDIFTINLVHYLPVVHYVFKLHITLKKLPQFTSWYWNVGSHLINLEMIDSLIWMHHKFSFLWDLTMFWDYHSMHNPEDPASEHSSFIFLLNLSLSLSRQLVRLKRFRRYVCTGDWDKLESPDLFLLSSFSFSLPRSKPVDKNQKLNPWNWSESLWPLLISQCH